MTRVRALWACTVFTVAVAGCRVQPIRSDWEIECGPVAPRNLESQEKADNPTVSGSDWKRGGGWFKDEPEHLTPDRIEGGIY